MARAHGWLLMVVMVSVWFGPLFVFWNGVAEAGWDPKAVAALAVAMTASLAAGVIPGRWLGLHRVAVAPRAVLEGA